MPPETLALLTAGIFAIALLYSSVGHAGASGYIAVMSLLGLAPAEIKPAALALNILVATIGSVQFWRAGHFRWPLFWPFAMLSVPYAWIGGYATLPGHLFHKLAGAVLLYSALLFLVRPPAEGECTPPSHAGALAVGGWIGLLAGATGTGGGIFLTPLMLKMRWAPARSAAAVSAAFILVNSVSGLSGHVAASGRLPLFAAPLLLAAGLGGTIGSWYGSRRFDPIVIKRLLAVVLLIAGTKLLLL